MRIETQRLKLRHLTADDAESYFRLSQNPGFLRFQISNYRQMSVESAMAWIRDVEQYHQRNGFGIVGVFLKEDSALIGLAAWKYLGDEGESPIEIMYRLSDLFWGEGFGSEIAAGLVKWGLIHLESRKLVGFVEPSNLASKRILEKTGFVFSRVIEIHGPNVELFELANFPKPQT